METNNQCLRLHPFSLGMACGIAWGVGMFLTGIIALYFDIAKPFVDLFSSIYIGYDATWLGSAIGGLYGFVDAFIGAIIVAWIYNCFIKCCGKACKTKD